MGHIVHDAVIVTVSDYVLDSPSEPVMPDVEAFRSSLPEEWQQLVVGPVTSIVNGYLTYAFLPDGSKSGWPADEQGDTYRDQFAALFAWTYEDGSSPFDVVRIQFGGDERYEPVITGPVEQEN